MSQYRDDHAAARLRIEALEALLAEQEAELARHDAALSARDEEIERLQRELELSGGLGPRRIRSVDAVWASRIVGATTGLALLAAAAGATMVHAPATGGAVPIVIVTDAPESPTHADPFVNGASDWTEPSQVSAPTIVPAIAPAVPGGAIVVQRHVEPRVWGERVLREENARLRKSLCGDDACRGRAQAELTRARDADQP